MPHIARWLPDDAPCRRWMLVDMNVISGSWAFAGPVQSVLD
jgi:hypothetical protein